MIVEQNKFPLDKKVIDDLKSEGLYRRVRALFVFFKQLEISLSLFWTVVFLSLVSTIFSAFGYQLFIPFLSALIAQDFNLENKVIGLSSLLPYFEFTPKQQMSVLFLLVLLVWIFKNLCSYFSALNGTLLAQRLDCNLKKAIIDRYFTFGKRFHDGRGVGFLNNVLTDFSSNVANQVFAIEKFFYNIFGSLVYGILMLMISWRLTLMATLFVPITIYLARKIIGKLKIASMEYAKVLDLFICNSFDLLMSLPLIRNVGKENYERERFFKNANSFVETKYKVNKYNCLVGPVKDMATIILSLVVALCIVLVDSPNNSPLVVSSYIVFFILLSHALPGLSAFADLEITLTTISVQFDLLLDSLELKPEWIITNGKKPLEKFNSKIEFRDVCFAYNENDFIKNVNFEINKGEVVALVGQAGAGKTTMTNLLLRHYELSKGGIYIDGIDTRELDIDSMREKMSVISQMNYFMDASLRENLLYGVIDHESIEEKHIDNIIEVTGLKDLVSRLPDGFDTRVSCRGGSLSGGEQQLLSVARAFLRDADIYILDEPTNALDARSFKKAQNAINKLIEGKTTLIIAHHLSTIRLANRIVLMEKGEVVEIGTIRELLAKKEKFYSYWMEQQEECYLCKM